MALQSQEIKNLIQGISQQPDWLRYPSQCESQINAFSSESDGLLKRSPTIFQKRLGDSDLISTSEPLIHMINRDASEQYYVICDGTSFQIFDLEGNAKTLNSSDSLSYISTTTPRENIKMLTVADYTFVVNNTVTVKQSSEYTDTMDWDHKALISVRGGQYGRTLSIGINDTWTAGLTLPDGSTSTDIEKMDTSYIITQLISQLETAFPAYTFTSGEGYIEITAPSGTTINKVQSKDGYNNELLVVVWQSVSQASSLPLTAPDGYMIEISGVTNNSEDNYYVKYNATKRLWQECAGSNVNRGVDPSTMPHVLIRESDGTFSFQEFSWGIRTAGDEDTNPDPSFVGNTINAVFYYSNRLGFLSGENVIMSRAAQYEDFYVASVAAVADDDMIDIASSDSRINILKYAIAFNEMLLLISNDTQFVLSANGTLTTKTINLDLATNFPVSDYAHPMSIGRGVYFCTPRSEYSQISRYYAVLDASNQNDSTQINSHCPNYIENGIFEISGSSTENFITLLTEGAKNRIYMYKFLYNGDSVQQQAWSHWEFPSDFEVLTAQCINSKMYLILKTNAGIFLETLEFTLNLEDLDNEPYRIYLDGKTTYTVPSGLYDEYTNRTTLTIKSFYNSIGWDCDLKLVTTDGVVFDVPQPDGGWQSDSTISLYGDYTGQVLIVGRVFKMTYEFSKLLIKQTADDGSVSTVTNGRFQLKRVSLSYKSTGAYDVSVVSGTRTSEYTFSAIRGSQADIGSVNNIVQNGQYRFPVMGDASKTSIIVSSEYPTPLSLVSCYFEGNYQTRTQGL